MSNFDDVPKNEVGIKCGIFEEIRQALGLGRIEQIFTGLGRVGYELDRAVGLDGEEN